MVDTTNILFIVAGALCVHAPFTGRAAGCLAVQGSNTANTIVSQRRSREDHPGPHRQRLNGLHRPHRPFTLDCAPRL